MRSGYWQVVWHDRDNTRRVDYADARESARRQWCAYVPSVGGRIVSMRLVSKKPEGPRHVVQEL